MKYNQFHLPLIAMTILAAFPSAATAQNQPGKTVRLSLELSNSKIVPYEPVCAWVILNNESDEQVIVGAGAWATKRIRVAKGDGEFEMTRHGIRPAPVGRRPLEPGQALVSLEILHWAQTPNKTPLQRKWKFHFPEPGEYRIKATVLYGKSTLESNPVTVKVVPGTEKDAIAAKMISEQFAAAIVQGFSAREGGVVILDQLVNQLPRTPHADFANYALGRYYSLKYRVPGQGVPKDITFAKRSAQHFAAVSPRVPALRADALLQIGHFEHVKDANIPEIIHEMELLQKQIPDPEMRKKLEVRRVELQKLVK